VVSQPCLCWCSVLLVSHCPSSHLWLFYVEELSCAILHTHYSKVTAYRSHFSSASLFCSSALNVLLRPPPLAPSAALTRYTTTRGVLAVMAARATSSTRSWSAAAAAIAALALLVATASAQTLQTTCYHKTNNVEHVTSPGGGPCGIVSPDTVRLCSVSIPSNPQVF
jgi:hypothetical protein